MTFGDRQQERHGQITKEAAFKILDTFYANGENILDTANSSFLCPFLFRHLASNHSVCSVPCIA
jgi:hypothetical protein